MTTRSISNSDDVIDYRDVIARRDELRDELDGLREAVKDAETDDERATAMEALAEWLEADSELDALQAAVLADQSVKDWAVSDDAQELKALQELCDDAEGYSDDWTHGATLIRDSYFKEYAEQLADDIGAIDRKAGWPLTHIDWEAAADELKQDSTSVEFDGVEYWVR